MSTRLTFTQVEALVRDTWPAEFGADEAIAQMRRWLRRGDGIAVYRDEDLGSSHLGELRFVSFGSAEAQLEVPEPPERLPDIAGMGPNWAFRLLGTCEVGKGPLPGTETRHLRDHPRR